MRIPRSLLVLIIIAGSCVAFLIGYIVIRPRDSSPNSQTADILARFGDLTNPDSSALPIPTGLFQISNNSVVSAVPKTGDTVLYYHADSGQVSQISITDRTDTIISQTNLANLQRTIWSPDRRQVISVFRSATGDQYTYYNYDTQHHEVIPGVVVDAAFSPDGSQIVFGRQSGDEVDIITSQPDGSQPQTILKTHFTRIALAWPSQNIISLNTIDETTGLATLYTLSPTGDLTTIFDGVGNLSFTWSPDGSQLLYSYTDENSNPVFAIQNITSGAGQALSYAGTASLCAWLSDNQHIVCVLSDQSGTSVSEISLADGSAQVLASDLVITPDSVFISADQSFLVLTGQSGDGLYALKLN